MATFKDLADVLVKAMKSPKGQAMMEEIRENHRRCDACTGHEFERIPREQRPAGVPASKPWHCKNCDCWFSGPDIIAYRQGLEHGAAGYELEETETGWRKKQ